MLLLPKAKKSSLPNLRKKGQITVVGCSSATEQSVPPFIFWKADKLLLEQRQSDWITVYCEWQRLDWSWVVFSLYKKNYFLVHAVLHSPLLLILDGHSTILIYSLSILQNHYFLPSTTHYTWMPASSIFAWFFKVLGSLQLLLRILFQDLEKAESTHTTDEMLIYV